jgi:iron complex transport system substrate-binding protein
MTVCSFLPAATSMIRQMGLDEFLVGVTFECLSDKPKVVRSYLEGNTYTSQEIEEVVSAAKKEGKPLYYIDEELLANLAPDILFTQDVCDVCQIDTRVVERAVYKLKKKPLIVPLIPRNLEDVYANALQIARAMNREEAGLLLVSGLRERTASIQNTLRQHQAPLKRVMVMEWLDPIYNAGHWIPYQVAQAGGVDMLSNPGGYSIVTSWEKVRQYNPEVLVVAPCGFDVVRTTKEISILSKHEGWNELLAVQNDAVFVADANLFTQPAATVVDGIELLAALFHPSLFSVSAHLKGHYSSLSHLMTRQHV